MINVSRPALISVLFKWTVTSGGLMMMGCHGVMNEYVLFPKRRPGKRSTIQNHGRCAAEACIGVNVAHRHRPQLFS